MRKPKEKWEYFDVGGVTPLSGTATNFLYLDTALLYTNLCGRNHQNIKYMSKIACHLNIRNIDTNGVYLYCVDGKFTCKVNSSDLRRKNLVFTISGGCKFRPELLSQVNLTSTRNKYAPSCANQP